MHPEQQGGGGGLGGHGHHGDGAVQDGVACKVGQVILILILILACKVGQVARRLLQEDEVAPIFSNARHPLVGADAIEVVEHLAREVGRGRPER